jgi:hypothetical protein
MLYLFHGHQFTRIYTNGCVDLAKLAFTYAITVNTCTLRISVQIQAVVFD